MTPRKQKKTSNLNKVKDVEEKPGQKAHTLVSKSKKLAPWVFLERKKNKEEFIKEYPHFSYMMESNAELEAFAGDLYRLIIGIRQAKYRSTEEGQIISKKIDIFVPFSQRVMSLKEALAKGIAAAFVASYFLQETDLHCNNIGVNHKNEIVRIDFDNSLCPSYREQFPANGILNLPGFPVGTDPFLDWSDWRECLIELSTSSGFLRDKYKYCLKIILLNHAIFKNIGLDNLSQENYNLVDHVENRRIQFEEFLLSDPTFKQYFNENRESYWNEIKIEFEEYNQELLRSITKLEVYLQRLLANETNFEVLPEFSKPKYQQLNFSQLKNKLLQEQEENRKRLINIEELYTRYTNFAAVVNKAISVQSLASTATFYKQPVAEYKPGHKDELPTGQLPHK